MAYLSSKLISNSFYLSKIISREFEAVSGQQESDALDELNDLLADKTIQNALIPYVQKLEITGIIGQSEYFVTDLIDVDTFTFFIGNTRYATRRDQRNKWFGESRQENIDSLPFKWHVEREFGGARLYLYFVPDQAYKMEVVGKFRLSSVTQQQDLSLTLDRYYIDFLKYELAARLCESYSFNVPPAVQLRLNIYQKEIKDQMNTTDLRQKKLSVFTAGGYINYASINLSPGWWPS